MTVLLILVAVVAAGVLGWRCCVALRVEPLLDELDAAVTDNAVLMSHEVAERDARAVAQRGALHGGAQ